MVPKTLGDILQPQPAPWLYCVSRTSSDDIEFPRLLRYTRLSARNKGSKIWVI